MRKMGVREDRKRGNSHQGRGPTQVQVTCDAIENVTTEGHRVTGNWKHRDKTQVSATPGFSRTGRPQRSPVQSPGPPWRACSERAGL